MELAAADPPVTLAMVDATVEMDITGRYAVQGFPSLRWFVKGELRAVRIQRPCLRAPCCMQPQCGGRAGLVWVLRGRRGSRPQRLALASVAAVWVDMVRLGLVVGWWWVRRTRGRVLGQTGAGPITRTSK